mgnify:CR=1 FL=1
MKADAIQHSLQERYGPLLSMSHLAELLHRSPDGLRLALRATDGYAAHINKAKIKIGRRVYFRTQDIADLLRNWGETREQIQ